MEQNARNKTKYNSPHSSATWSTKQTDARVSPDVYWKYAQRSNQDAAEKNTRRHQIPVEEPAVNYYSSANSYKNMKHHSHPCPTYPKHSSALHTETSHRYQQTNAKSSRSTDYANNVAVMKKDRYKNQQEGENDTEYLDEMAGNCTEDNLAEDADDEAVNDQEGVVESLDKEYDEQDDQADDESDMPAEPQVMQRNAAKKEALLRAQQRLRTINQQQDSHRIHYRQHSPRLHQAHTLATRYYSIPDHDIHEALSEEDLYVAQALKSPPRRSSAGYYQNWVPQRSSADRYDTTTSPAQLSRRARTRPESKPFMEVEFVDRRKCSRCGSISIRKPSSPRRNSYRFQDSSSFPSKGRFADDAEILDPFWCGHCKPRHYVQESRIPSEIPSPALYTMKSRRSRDTGTPMHETLEGKCAADEISHGYTRIPLRYAKDASNVPRDRIRQQSVQGPTTRTSVRYEP